MAVADIPLGTVVTAEMFTSRTMAVDIRDANVYGDASQAVGKTTRTAIAAGAQVHSTDFQDRAVPLTVPVGRRAMTISVNEMTGVGNLVDVGDNIDLLISLRGDAFPVVQVLSDGSVTVVAGINPLSVKLPLLLQDVQIIGVIDDARRRRRDGRQRPARRRARRPVITGAEQAADPVRHPGPGRGPALRPNGRHARRDPALARLTPDRPSRRPVSSSRPSSTSTAVLPPEIVQVPIPTPAQVEGSRGSPS